MNGIWRIVDLRIAEIVDFMFCRQATAPAITRAALRAVRANTQQFGSKSWLPAGVRVTLNETAFALIAADLGSVRSELEQKLTAKVAKNYNGRIRVNVEVGYGLRGPFEITVLDRLDADAKATVFEPSGPPTQKFDKPVWSGPTFVTQDGVTVPISRGGTVIGRTVDGAGRIDDPKVSAVHATVTDRVEWIELLDHQSSNGTWRGEERLAHARIQHGDRIRFGRTYMTASLHADDKPSWPGAEGPDPIRLATTAPIVFDKEKR